MVSASPEQEGLRYAEPSLGGRRSGTHLLHHYTWAS